MIEFGKIYKRSNGEVVYSEYIIPLKMLNLSGLVEAVNVVTGDTAFFTPSMIRKLYSREV